MDGSRGSHAHRRLPVPLTFAAALALALAPTFISPSGAQASTSVRAFTPRFSVTAQGALTIIGNTLESCQTATAGCPTARAGTAAPVANNNNNNWTMAWVDVDGNSSTTNSSSATLSLPAGSTVEFAELTWGGCSSSAQRGVISFAVPGSGYVDVSAVRVDTNSAGNCTGAQINYSAVADVTPLVAGLANPNGTYWGANVQSTVGATDKYAAWALVVVYQNLTLPLRNLVVFDGYAMVNGVAPTSVSTTVSGFLTPAVGVVNTKIGAIVYEGDIGFTNDSMQLNGVTLSNGLNPAGNFFNSSVTIDGTRFSNKNPDYVNQMAFDADIVDASGILANSSTSATITYASTDPSNYDTYYPTVVTFQTDVFTPVVDVVKTSQNLDHTDAIYNGDHIRYTLTATSTGNDPATFVVLSDPIPSGLTYVPGSAVIVSGENAGAKTDALGDDQVDFQNNTITFRLGIGANATMGGQMPSGAVSTIQFDTVVNNVPAGTHLVNQAFISYSGLTLGGGYATSSDSSEVSAGDNPDNQVTNAPPVAIADTFVVLLNTQTSLSVLDNDWDPDGNIDPSTVTIVSGPSHGTVVSIDPVTGAVTYNPTTGYTGTDSFTYRVCDTVGQCSEATATITVRTTLWTPPTARPDGATTPQATAVVVDVLANDSAGSSALVPGTTTVIVPPAFGTTSVNATNGRITYTPSASFWGQDTLIYQVCDGNGLCDSALVTIDVTKVDHAPTAVNDSASANMGWPATVVVLANDTDPENNINIASVSVQTSPLHGTVGVNANGTITYTPAPGYTGTDTFTYRVCDTTSPTPLCSNNATVTMTIAQAVLTITASSDTMVYGSSVPVVYPIYSGWLGSDDASVLTTEPVCSTTATSASPVGPYTTTCSGAVDDNYAFSYVDGSITVTPAPLTVTAPTLSRDYGQANPPLTPNYSGFVNGDDAGDLTAPATCTTSATPASPPGSYPITCSGALGSNYDISYVEGTLTIGKATLTVTASSPSMTYGDTVPTITPQYSGFVNGDTAAVLDTPPTCTTGATSGSPAGSYATTCSGGVDDYYDFVYVDGSLTVGPVVLTVTASSDTMVYGGSVPVITPSYTGFVNGDDASDIDTEPTCSTTATSGSDVGSYPSTCSGGSDDNYTFVYVPGSVTIVKATITVTASDGSMSYGGSVPAITPSYSGFVNGDTAADIDTPPTCTTTATATSPAGTYPSTCSGAVDDNYDFTYVPGTVTVEGVTLTITASSGSMTYGGTVPTITPQYSGFVNGDGPSDLDVAPTCTTAATSSSPVGSYASTCSGAADSNYIIVYVPGTVTVEAAVLTITASSGSMTYGGTVPTITPQYSGFVNGDGPSSLIAAPICTTTATSSSPVGSYPSSCSGAVNPNYDIHYVGGTVTITAATLTITASSGAMVYGSTVPAIAPQYSGFVNGDTAADLTTQPTCSTTATSSSPVGSYPSSCSGAVDPNYDIQYVGGTITVTAASLTITASSGTMSFGGTVPTITPQYSGFVNGDTAADLTTQPTCSTAATSSSPVGSYPSSCSGAVDPNYDISYVDGTVTVTGATLTVTASSATVVYGGTVPAITPAYSGWVNGDTVASLTTAASCSTSATSSSPVGSYPSSCSGAAIANYTIVYVDGTVTISPADLTITASGGTMVYGGTPPSISPSYSGWVNGDDETDLTTPPTCGTTATSSSPVGSYPSSCTGAVAPNYDIHYVSGTVTVTPAGLTITASDAVMAQGGTVPTITPQYTGWVNGDDETDLTTPPTCTTSATSASPAGTYPSSCSGAVDPNYDIHYVPGTVTVTGGAGIPTLTITASSATMTYGGTVPAITPQYSGWVNGDGPSDLTAVPDCTTAATGASPVGSYTSSCSGAAEPDYIIVYVAGTVTVNPAPLTVTASSHWINEGDPVPTITAQYTGWVNGDTAADLTTQPTCSTTATTTSPVGTYPSTCTGAVHPDYDIGYVDGTVTVNPAGTQPTPTPTAPRGTAPATGTAPAGSGRDGTPYLPALLALVTLVMACVAAYIRLERLEARRRIR